MWDALLYDANRFNYYLLIEKLIWPIGRQNRIHKMSKLLIYTIY